MNALRRGHEILTEAESSLKRLMEKEITAGRYEELASLALLANRLANASSTPPPSTAPSIDPVISSTTPRPLQSASKKKKSQAKSRTLYPKFCISQKTIEKTGWSKQKKKEYRHYAPCSAAKAVAQQIDDVSANTKRWTVDDLGEIADKATGASAPGYQVYLVIAWMRSQSLIEKIDRSRYMINGNQGLTQAVSDLLSAAPH